MRDLETFIRDRQDKIRGRPLNRRERLKERFAFPWLPFDVFLLYVAAFFSAVAFVAQGFVLLVRIGYL